MKRVATKEDVVLATCRLIARDGIRAIRVDYIAELLGMSKRTLYQMFASKDELMSACFDVMSLRQREKITGYLSASEGNAMACLLNLVTEYVDGLYHVDVAFLDDIVRQKSVAEHMEQCRMLWRQELSRGLEQCREEGCLLPQTDTEVLARQILSTFFELRVRCASTHDDDLKLARMILRGASTPKGMSLLEV